MRKAFLRLRMRLTAVCAASTGLVLVLMAIYAYLYAASQFHVQAEKNFEKEVTSILYTLGTQEVVNHDWLNRAERAGSLLLRVESPTRQSEYTGQVPLREELTALARQTAADEYGFDAYARPSGTLAPDTCFFILQTEYGSFRVAVARVPTGDSWRSVAVLGDRGSEQARINSLRIASAAGAFVAILILVVFAWFFTVWAARPIAENHKKQSEFISAVSHELRTPLAVMQMNAENIAGAPSELVEEFASVIVSECGRLARLTGDMLRLAKADGQDWAMTLSPAHPEGIVISSIERFALSARKKGVSLLDGLPSDTLPKINCDAGRLEQVLGILLDNALRYTPSGGTIKVELRRKRRFITFTVSDSGVGVPNDKKRLIFERFYRGDTARSDGDHHGLGLSIALEIVMFHGGELTVGDSPLGGAEFMVSIPVGI